MNKTLRASNWLLPLATLAVALAASCGDSSGDRDGGSGDGGCPTDRMCGSSCCGDDQYCFGTACLDTTGPCEDDACSDDARCVEGWCIPWDEFGADPYDPECTREVEPGAVRAQLQCAWQGDPATDPTPGYHVVRHTPLVVDFHLGDIDVPMGPSIVVIGDAVYQEGVPRVCESTGTLFVLDGRTCGELYKLDGDGEEVLATVTPALADLDGDGSAEIIAPAPDGGLRAFTLDRDAGHFVKLWDSTDSGGIPSTLGVETCLWGGITVADLDGGDSPEIFFHGAAHDATGRIIATLPGYQYYNWGNPMVVVDADLDGEPEVVEGYGTYDYVAGVGFQLISGWVGTGGAGFIAVADFGDFPGAAGNADGRPEVVVVDGSVRVQTVLGEVVFSHAGGYGSGGPPTVADFDNDGRAEFGVAFGDQYVVYDLDCVGAPDGCESDGILWTSPSKDMSSARTGSSVFDFNGDGRAEVVYGDECFVRVYDGASGSVLFSQGRFSSTWEENAIVADVDGDASAEIVLPASSKCSPGYCGEWDMSFPGLACETADDCPGGSCDEGLCRCILAGDCGDSFECTTPLPGTPGSGNVCRTRHQGCLPGIRVYRDARDRWAGSRPVWNQHAYYVTNVDDDGQVPAAGTVLDNWQQPGLNNFRQNVQGEVGPLPAADLTASELDAECDSDGETVTLTATVCNRGGSGADAGVTVRFVDTANGDAVLCTAATTEFLEAGYCQEVSCDATLTDAASIEARVNGDGAVGECEDGNNQSSIVDVQCVG